MKLRNLAQAGALTAVTVCFAGPTAQARDQDLGKQATRRSSTVVVDPAVIARHRSLGRLRERNANAVRTGSSTVTIVEPSPFDWGDAGVGAAGTFGLMLVAGGVVMIRRHGAS